MAVGDLLGNDGRNELVVGALDGHLFVFDLDPTTGDIGAKLYETQVEGAVGANNSIVIADIDGQANKELYVAGSQGLWKWVQ